MKKVVSALLLSLVVSIGAFAQETMTNDEVISLTKAGLAGSIIIGKINSSATNFDMSTDALIKLKQAGVSDDVVGAMLAAKSGKSVGGGSTAVATNGDPNDPMSKHGFGVYLFQEVDGKKKMTQIQPSMSGQNRTAARSRRRSRRLVSEK